MSAAGTVIRALTPVGRGVLLLVAAILLVLVAGRLGVRWDPFGLHERRLERAQARAVVAEAETAARSLEVVGARPAGPARQSPQNRPCGGNHRSRRHSTVKSRR